MSAEREKAQLWRNLTFTLRVLRAQKLAEAELAGHMDEAGGRGKVAPLRPRSRPLAWSLLAAQGADPPSLPRALTLASGALELTCDAKTEPGTLLVTLQLKGYAAVKAWAGRPARLVSTAAEGALDLPFAFDAGGRTRLRLPDTKPVRAALLACEVRAEPVA